MGLSLERVAAGGILGRLVEHGWVVGLPVTTVPAQKSYRYGFRLE